jgi:flagellar motor switch protein FliM
MTTITKTDQTLQHQVLDPCLLGRPVHLLHVFAAQLREDLALVLREPLGRRYWGAYQIDAVGFSRVESDHDGDRWLNFAAGSGTIGFALERKVLLSVLNYRYGRSNGKPAVLPDPATVRVTATEERLAVVLGQQLAAALQTRIRSNVARVRKAANGAAAVLPTPAAAATPAISAALATPAVSAGLTILPGVHPVRGTWVISVAVSDVHAGEGGQFRFSLDKAMMADVLHGLLPEREQAKKSMKSVSPLASRLQVSLDGRLVSKEMPLGTLLELRVGDVIPISLSRTDVLLEESRLFTAAVTEHKGKLCLTSFEDAE